MTTRDRVMDALGAVYDPELDEPITTLRFISACEVSVDGDVQLVLRLPTPQCAPNFAFLMAADARNAVRGLVGVRDVVVMLEDHYTGEEINAALGRGDGFTGAFPGETADDQLESLRELFLRKALVARQGRICQALLAEGASHERLAAMRVGELADGPETRRCLELRAQLGIDAGPQAPAFVAGDGQPIGADQVGRWVRVARLVATSLEANGGICRALLQFRHGLADDCEEVSR
jgi:metal-sulfur cluster biosynthetic enzyme